MPPIPLKLLGEGGMSSVYLAELEPGRPVALKLLSRVQPDQVALFEKEAALLVKLRHPAIAAIHGYLADSSPIFGKNRGPCFWMDFVEGRGLLDAAKTAAPAAILAWLRAALDALRTLHAQNLAHGDLSPRNVLITAEGRIKLLDFGLAGNFSSAARLGAGTLPYLAPERWQGKNLPASDLFSLGTLFYEAFAGKHPRASSRSLSEMLRSPARPLLEAAPRLKDGFGLAARTIDRMIQSEPQRRWTSAAEALEALSGLSDRGGTVVAEHHSIRMFGAEAAFARLVQALARWPQGSAWLWLHGIGGVGKTRFLREAAFQCALRGIPVQEVPPSGFETALAGLAAAPAGAYFFHDLHKLGFDSLKGLLRLRREAADRPGRIGLFEWNEDRLSPETRRLLEALVEMPGGFDLRLKNLSEAESRTLIDEAIGVKAAGELAAALFRQTAGNPRMLLEIVRRVREAGGLERGHFSREWIERLAGWHSFEDLALDRLGALTGEERESLLALAAAGEAVAMAELKKICRDPEGLESRLHRLADRHLVKSAGDAWELAFPALATELLRRAEAAEIERLHQAWWKILPPNAERQVQRLRHALALGDGPAVAALALPAVESLSRGGRAGEALALAERSRPYIQDPVELSRLLRAKANLLTGLDRYREAIAAAEEVFALAAEDEPLPLKEAKCCLVAGIAHLNLGEEAAAARRFERCLELKAESSPEIRPHQVRALSLLGNLELKEGRLASAKLHFERGLAIAEPKGRRRAELCRNLAGAWAEERAWTEAFARLAEAKALYREEKYFPGEFAAWLQEGNLALAQGEAEKALAAYREAESLARSQRDDLFLARVWNNRGSLQRRRLALGEALEDFRRAHEVLSAAGNLEDLAEHLAEYARAEFAAGRFVPAEAKLAELRALAPRMAKAEGLAREVEAYGRRLREPAQSAVAEPMTGPAPAWDLEAALAAAEGPKLRELLTRIYESLPPQLQISFVEREDWRRWVGGQDKGKTPMEILHSLSAISRELLREDDMEKVLQNLMDAAMRLARAEHGFLLLRSESSEGPIAGFSVVVARNLAAESLQSKDFAFSLSAVRRAMEGGQAVVADNALTDPRFREAKSVQLHELKSILALPIRGRSGVLGAFYLDHRFEAGLFDEGRLKALEAFSDQAALALQKGQMIEELKRANARLSERVEEQSDQLEKLQLEVAESRIKLKHEYREIVGRSPRMIEVLALLDKITDSKIAVWVYGESGTGKESIARALHFNSGRAKQAFVAENCSALPETLMESELFGHKKGAFTHADRDKKGILEYAHRGTIFLDEIADLSPALQAKLLRFLQEGEIRPLGSHEVVKVDVRVVSASNKNLQELVEQGKFREDLYFRLNGVTISLPPLRERKEDLPLLVEHFLKRIAEREGRSPARLGTEALRQFMSYPWPGNIRELQNTLETAGLFADQGLIGLKALAFKPELLGNKKAMQSLLRKTLAREPLDPELERILLAIRDQGYHKGHAAQALGISRRNLYTKLEKFQVPVEIKSLKEYIDEKFL